MNADAPILQAFQAPVLRGNGAKKSRTAAAGPGHVALDDGNPEKGLAKLALTLMDLLRRLCEKQAIRRVEGGSLSDEEIERLGTAFLRLERKMEELKAVFGLEGEELNLDLGPLGDLM